LLTGITGNHAAVVRQGQRHPERAVARKDPDLETFPGTAQLHQQRHELALLGCRLHARHGVPGSLCTQALQDIRFTQGDRKQVVMECSIQRQDFI
jgi:hypothetical protein